MATSGSVKTSSYDGRYYQLSWTATQSITNNTSTVSWTLKALGGAHDWYAERTLKVVVDGSAVYSKTDMVKRYTGTVATGSKVIKHNDNGDANFSVEIQAAVYYSSVNCTGSEKFSLTNIPRKSTLTVANGTLDTEQTLNVTRKSTAFTHTIVAVCGNASKTIVTKSGSTSIKFTPPIEWSSQNTTGTAVTVRYTITTYNGNTSVGSNSYTKSCIIPSKVKPSCVVAVTDPTGYKNTYGKAIKGLSKLSVVVTPTTSYGSAIESYKATANGSTYTKANFTTDVLKSSGNLNVSAVVTDKRGRTSDTATESIGVYDYVAPSISKMTVYRCNEDGTSNSSGSFLAVRFNASVTSLDNQNTAIYQVQYKKTTEADYNAPVTLTDYNNQYSITNGVYVFSADTTASYDIILIVEDDFKNARKSGTGSSIKKLWSILKKGLGFAFGKVAELEDFLDIAFSTVFRKDVYIENRKTIYVIDTDGNYVNVFQPQNSNGHTVIGYDNYVKKSGNTHIYGNDVALFSAAAGNVIVRPYYRKGDSVSLIFNGAGFVTTGAAEIFFSVPLAKPVIGSPIVTASSVGGLILRQNNKYTHGSQSGSTVSPGSYSATIEEGYVRVVAKMNDTTNATNNDSIGINWSGKITFS